MQVKVTVGERAREQITWGERVPTPESRVRYRLGGQLGSRSVFAFPAVNIRACKRCMRCQLALGVHGEGVGRERQQVVHGRLPVVRAVVREEEQLALMRRHHQAMMASATVRGYHTPFIVHTSLDHFLQRSFDGVLPSGLPHKRRVKMGLYLPMTSATITALTTSRACGP